MKKLISSITMITVLLAGSIGLASAQGVSCVSPGEFHDVTYDFGVNASQSRSILARVGADYGTNDAGGTFGCMGRCGADCFGAPSIGRMYTADCLAHDVCSFEQNASGGLSDSNCGNEFRDAIDDTALAVFNICRYPRGDHRRAADGLFPQDPPS